MRCLQSTQWSIYRWAPLPRPGLSEIPLVSRKEPHPLHSHSTITAEPEVAPLMVSICWTLWHRNWCLYSSRKGTQLAAAILAGGEVGVLVALNLIHPLFQLDPCVLILILEISTISECHLAQVQTLLAFQLSHRYHLSLRPYTFPFDSSSPKES